MEIINFDIKYLNYILSCTHSNNKDNVANEVQEIRKEWIFKNLNKGLKIKIALRDREPLGFIHSSPIELSPELTGANYYTIPCLAINYQNIYSRKTGSGVGRKLINSIENDIKQNANGISAIGYNNNFWFMPVGFFKNIGFEEINRIGQRILLVKKYKESDLPSFAEFNYDYIEIKNKTVVDYYWNSMCPAIIQEYLNIKEVAKKHQNLIFNEYNYENCNIGKKHPRRLYINGKLVNLEDTFSQEEFKKYLK